MKVKGWCPMGCGETLVTLADHSIACEADNCPRPFAVAEILADNETEHIAMMYEETYSVKHPLRERLDDKLLDCDVHRAIRDEFAPPREGTGLYRVRVSEGEGIGYLLTYEKLGPLPRPEWDDEDEGEPSVSFRGA